jgi:flotillin
MGMALIGIAVVALLAIIILVKKMLYICQPNQVLIFSGTHRRVGRRTVGYKVIHGGRKLKLPLIEKVDRIDLTNMAINVAVRGAFSHGGIPLNVEGVANLKVAGEEPILGNAVERLLGKRREEIMAIAKETLEGNLRGVLAKLTPEQVNEDKLAFAKQLMDEADNDLNRLGLVLDTLKIQNVSDDVGYLDCIGRIKGAEIRRDATIAEANSQAASVVKDASNVRETEVVRIDAAIRTLEADIKRKIADAQTQRAARVAEEKGAVLAKVAQAQAEVEVQRARIEQTKRQLEADVLEPARAQMDAAINEARGAAAKIIEDGRATAQTLGRITEAWKQAGEGARDVFLMNKLQTLVDTMTRTVESVKIDKVTVLGVGQAGDGLAPKVISAAEQIKATLGVDILGALQQRLGPGVAASPRGAPDEVQIEVAPPPAPRTPRPER